MVTEDERRLIPVGLTIAEEGITVVGVPIGTGDYVREFAMIATANGQSRGTPPQLFVCALRAK